MPIAPGQTLTQGATRDVILQEMPQACGEGAVTAPPDCTRATCQPLEFTTQGQWYFEDLTLMLCTSE